MTDQEDIIEILTDRISELTCSNCQSVIDVSAVEPFTKIACPACNTELIVPAKLGPFWLLRLLGTGGMGAVYHGLDHSLGRNVAIKVMLKSFGEDAESMAAFQTEARMAAALNHPNIVQVYSFGQEKGQPYLAMELVSGKSLDEMISVEHPMDEGQLIQIARDTAHGLSAADEIGLIHSDVKPKNILLDVKGVPKIVDFGLASFAGKQAGEQGIWGSPYYIAPEKVRRQRVDVRSDIYSLGATIYHCITGVPPFDGETAVDVVKARLGNAPRPLTMLRKDILPETNNVVLRMLEENPAKRYPTYASLIGDFDDILEQVARRKKKSSGQIGVVMTKKHKKPLTTAVTDRQAPAAVERRPAPSSWGMIVAIVAAIAVIALLVVAILVHQSRKKRRVALARINAQVQREYDTLETATRRRLSALRQYNDQVIREKKRYESLRLIRAPLYCGEAVDRIDAAIKKVVKIDGLLQDAKTVQVAMAACNDVATAQQQKMEFELLAGQVADLQAQIEALDKQAKAWMKKAREEAKKITEQSGPRPQAKRSEAGGQMSGIS